MFAQVPAAQGGHAFGAFHLGEDNSRGAQHFKVVRARCLGNLESNFAAGE